MLWKPQTDLGTAPKPWNQREFFHAFQWDQPLKVMYLATKAVKPVVAVWSVRVPNMHRSHPCGKYCKTKDSINGCFNGYWLGIYLISRGHQISKTSERKVGTYQVQGRKFYDPLLKSSFKWLRGTDYQRDNQRRQEKMKESGSAFLRWNSSGSICAWLSMLLSPARLHNYM